MLQGGSAFKYFNISVFRSLSLSLSPPKVNRGWETKQRTRRYMRICALNSCRFDFLFPSFVNYDFERHRIYNACDLVNCLPNNANEDCAEFKKEYNNRGYNGSK